MGATNIQRRQIGLILIWYATHLKKGSHEYRPSLLTRSQPSWPVSSEIMASL